MKAEILETERMVLKPLSLEHLTKEYIDWLMTKWFTDISRPVETIQKQC